MQNLDLIADELFNKIRGRFPSVTIGDEEGNVTNEPKLARYFDFNFMNEGRPVGKVSISLDNKNIAVVYGEDLVANEGDITKNNWYNFLKELRMFARKRALTFDTRDITKSNLNSRDYKFLAKNRGGEENMTESKMYGTSRVSYQDFDGARLMIKHTESIDQAAPGGRAKKVGGLYIESSEGERFKYPYKHLTGARAMARHVAEGGNAYDDFGKHIVSMSEEMNKLRKFKTYMGRSAVMAESLAGYMDVVKERIATVKKTLESLQKPAYYKEAFEGFETAVLEEVPSDVAENWIDQLTIKQFNEELADVFPYIYKLVSEATKAEELTAEDLMNEKDPCWKGYKQIGMKKKGGKEVPNCVPEELELESAFEKSMGQFAEGAGEYSYRLEYNGEENGYTKHKLIITSPEGKTKEVADDFTYFDTEDPEELQAELESWFNKGHGVGDEDMDEGFDPEEFEGEFEYEGVGDDGETTPCTVSYTAKVDDMGRPVVDPKSISIDCQQDGNSKLGFDADMDLEMQDMKELLQMAQEDADEMWDSRDNKYAHGEADDDTIDVKMTPDSGIEKADKEEQKTPLGEFILSYYDRETGEFPKGETAVLTMVEKDYGEKFIEPAKQFIMRVYEVTEQYREPEVNPEFERMRELAGLR